MNIKQLFITLAAFGAATITALGSDGSPAYNFLNVPLSSRIYGLGGVNITLVDDDITTIEQNPALLGREMSKQLSLGYMRYIGESNFAGIRYANAVGAHGAISGAVNYFGYGEVIEADEFGNQLGKISPKDLSFSVAYSHDITDRLRGGANLKFLYSAYSDYSALALATDLGINYYDPERDMSLSLVVANLGGQIKRFSDSYDRLPIDVRLGWSQTFGTFPLRFSVTAWNLTKWKLPYYKVSNGIEGESIEKKESFGSNLFRHLVFGVDLVSSPNWYIGLGYNYKTRTDMSSYHRTMLSGISLAAGLKVRSFGFGLAFAQPHSGATTLMLNLNLSISEIIR